MPSNISVVVGATTVGANYLKHQINQADVGRELIVKIASNSTINDAELSAAIAYITLPHGSAGSGDSAFTVAAVGTATGAAFESGDLTVGADFGATGVTAALVASFDQNY